MFQILNCIDLLKDICRLGGGGSSGNAHVVNLGWFVPSAQQIQGWVYERQSQALNIINLEGKRNWKISFWKNGLVSHYTQLGTYVSTINPST